MICNVHTDEGDLDENKKHWYEDNCQERFLQGVDDIESKLEFLFMRPSPAKTNHLILRCDSEIRKLIHDNGDKIRFAFARYDIPYQYFTPICFYW